MRGVSIGYLIELVQWNTLYVHGVLTILSFVHRSYVLCLKGCLVHW